METAAVYALAKHYETMKAIVGVDTEGLYLSAIHLLSRLRLEGLTAELIHVDEPSWLFGPSTYPVAGPVSVSANQTARATRSGIQANGAMTKAKAGKYLYW